MITVDVDDQGALAKLDDLAAVLDDLTPVMNEIGMALTESTKARFAAEKDPDGNSWAPRSVATLENYNRRKLSYGGILHLTGVMGQTIFHEYGPDFVAVGSGRIQSAVMQFGAAKGAFGANVPWGNIPARPFLGLADDDKTNIIDIISETLDRIVGN